MKTLWTVRIVVAMILALSVAPAAKAVVMVGFKLGTIGSQPLFTYDNNGTPTNLTDDTLAAANTVNFSVSVDGGPETIFSNAGFDFNLAAPPTITAAGSDVTFFLDGSFTISDGADSVLTVDFEGAELHFNATPAGGGDFILSKAGANFIGNDAIPGQSVTYTAGSSATFLDLLNGLDFGGSQEFSFTVETLNEANPFFDAMTMIMVSDEPGVGESFVFDSSFSGQSELVPEPAALSMIGLGVLAMVRRRRSN